MFHFCLWGGNYSVIPVFYIGIFVQVSLDGCFMRFILFLMSFIGGDDDVCGFLHFLPGFSTVGRSHLVVDAVQEAPKGPSLGTAVDKPCLYPEILDQTGQ